MDKLNKELKRRENIKILNYIKSPYSNIFRIYYSGKKHTLFYHYYDKYSNKNVSNYISCKKSLKLIEDPIIFWAIKYCDDAGYNLKKSTISRIIRDEIKTREELLLNGVNEFSISLPFIFEKVTQGNEKVTK